MADTFETLLKVARSQRDTASQAVNTAAQRLEEANRKLTDLASAEEGAAFADEVGFAAGSYLRRLRHQRQQVLSQLPQLQKRLALSQDELLDAFGECKKMEFVQERQRQLAEAEEKRRNEARLDEIAQRLTPRE